MLGADLHASVREGWRVGITRDDWVGAEDELRDGVPFGEDRGAGERAALYQFDVLVPLKSSTQSSVPSRGPNVLPSTSKRSMVKSKTV